MLRATLILAPGCRLPMMQMLLDVKDEYSSERAGGREREIPPGSYIKKLAELLSLDRIPERSDHLPHG